MDEHNHNPEPRSAKAKFPYYRQLKVRKGYWDHHFARINRLHPYRVPPPVPWIQVKGYWLNQAGFTIGTSVQAKVSKGKIVLTIVPAPEPPDPTYTDANCQVHADG